MVKPLSGNPVKYSDYINKGSLKLHLIGILGGVIWSIGMSFSIIASGAAGFAISYGLGQGATMVAAFWGVFIWKEFKDGDNQPVMIEVCKQYRSEVCQQEEIQNG